MATTVDGILRAPAKEEISAQVRRVLGSAVFQNSESSRQLLAYLSQWSLDHPGSHVKESEVAVSVFHREPAAFDSQTDSVVRVQMARLRAKLNDYYGSEGAADEVLIEVPKGAYYIVSSYRAPEVEDAAAAPEPVVEGRARRRVSRAVVIALGAGALLGAAIALISIRLAEPGQPPHLRGFWAPFLESQAAPLVVFSNPRLSGTLASTGLRYYQEDLDAKTPGAENLSYTGSGDVRSIYTLTRLFDAFRQQIAVRSGALLSWDQARDANLIFIGRPEQNPALHKLPRLREFYFKSWTGIVNAHPRAGEQASYGCSDRPYTEDYAVIALVPGLTSSRKTLILAGTTTYGSQAAVEYVSRENSVAALMEQAGAKPGAAVPFFEALLKVRINNETPVWSQVIATRLTGGDASWVVPSADER